MKIMYKDEKLCEVDVNGLTTLDDAIAEYLGIKSVRPENEEDQKILEQMYDMFDFVKKDENGMCFVDTTDMRFDGSLN